MTTRDSTEKVSGALARPGVSEHLTVLREGGLVFEEKQGRFRIYSTNEDLSRIVVDVFHPHPAAKVWRALTAPEILAQWLMPSDFQPVVGQEFTMEGTADEKANISGTVKCTVPELEPEHTLRSTVTWTRETEGNGTRVFLEQAGYGPEDPVHQMARTFMSGGWTRGILPKLGEVLAA